MVTSVSNEKVKHIVRLQKKASARQEENCFLVEGVKMAQELPLERLVLAYVSESFAARPEQESLCRRLQAETVADHVLAAMSDTRTPQGILAVVRRRELAPETVWQGENPLLLVLERLQDPGNLGTILRTAEGAGVTGVILSNDCVDLYNPKVIRSTMGSVYRLPVAYAADLPEAVAQMRAAGIRTYAAHLKGEATYDQEDYRGATAFLIGNEGAGLSPALAAASDCYIRIPMAGQVESLNAAVASAILMYEVNRQRREGKSGG